MTRQAGHDDKLNFHTDFFQVCQHRAGDHGKAPLPDNTSLGSCNQSPFLLSLCQHECRPNPANHQHSARNKFQKFLFIADFPAPLCHVQEVKLWYFGFFNPSKIIQLNLFMPYENLVHTFSTSSNTTIIKYFKRQHSSKCFWSIFSVLKQIFQLPLVITKLLTLELKKW